MFMNIFFLITVFFYPVFPASFGSHSFNYDNAQISPLSKRGTPGYRNIAYFVNWSVQPPQSSSRCI